MSIQRFISASARGTRPSLRGRVLIAANLVALLPVPASLAQTVTLISNHPSLTNPGAITTDGVHLYVGNGTTILSMPIGGGAATTLYAGATPCCVVGLTQLGTDLFWIDPNGDPDATAIFRGSTSGGPISKVYSGFATGQPIVDGVGITTDGTKLYTTDSVQGRVHSLNPDGSAITFLGSRYGGFFVGEHFNTLAESGGILYITDDGTQPSFSPPLVVSIPKTGGSFTTLHSGAPFVRPVAIAVGNGTVFVADQGANKIWSLPITGGAPTALVLGAPFVQLGGNGLIFFNNALYVADSSGIYRVDFGPPPNGARLIPIRPSRPLPPARLIRRGGPGSPTLLAGAFNFPGPYPMPTNVTYANKSGKMLTTVAIPDQVFMAVSPALLSAASATQLITTNGGTVIAQMPMAGLYWIRVRPGAAAPFISAVQGDSAVIHVGPNVPLTGSQIDNPLLLFGDIATTPLSPGSCGIAQFDLFRLAPGNNVCGLTHGQGVNSFLGQDGLCTAKYDVTMLDGETNQPALLNGHHALALGSDVGFALARTAEGGSLERRKLIVNLSIGAIGDPNDGLDRRVCETNPANPICFCPPPPNSPDCVGNYAAWESDAFGFLVGIVSAVRYMPQELRDSTVVVVSAGNSGLDLTQEIGLLRSFFDDLPQVLIVGSLENGQPFPGHNHSTDPSHMLYAPGVDVPVPGTAGCRTSGTSFAAPAVANLVAQLAQRFPTLTSAQLVTAIQNAAPSVNGLRTIPTLAQAEAAARAIAQPPPPGQLTFNAPAALPSAVVGTAYDYSFCDPRPTTGLCGAFSPTRNPTGGNPPYHFQLESGVGFPPFGISLNLNGILSGTPSAAARATFGVCAVDQSGAFVCRRVSLVAGGVTWSVSVSWSAGSQGGACAFASTLPLDGGSQSFICGIATATFTTTRTSMSVSGLGNLSGEGFSCSGNGGGSSGITETQTSFSGGGSIGGSSSCTFSDGTSETFAVTGTFSASAPK